LTLSFKSSVADPDLVPFLTLDPGSGIGRNQLFGVKILKFFDADPGWRQFRDGKKSDPGSGINIPDPQHCLEGTELLPVAVPVLGLLQCRGILHAQQQAPQQHLGVRRLHLHLKVKTTFRTCFTTAPRRVSDYDLSRIWIWIRIQ
jgi:hypothetical protein